MEWLDIQYALGYEKVNELELIQFHMTQNKLLRGEVGARALDVVVRTRGRTGVG